MAAPDTGNSHIDLSGNLIPGHAFVTELQDLLGGGGVSRRAATRGYAGAMELLADSAPMNAQLGTDLVMTVSRSRDEGQQL